MREDGVLILHSLLISIKNRVPQAFIYYAEVIKVSCLGLRLFEFVLSII